MSSIATQSTILAFEVNLFLTFYVLLKLHGWNRALNRNFAVLSFSFALWNLGLATKSQPLIYTGVFMTAPAFYMFLLTLLRQFGQRQRLNGLILTASSICLIFLSFYLLYQPDVTPLTNHLLSIFAFGLSAPVFIWGAYKVGNRVRYTRSNLEQARLVYVLVGMTAAAIAGIAAAISTLGIINLQSWTPVAGLIYTVSISIAILRHRLFDVGKFTSRLVVIIFLATIFWLLLGTLGHFYIDNNSVSFLSLIAASIVLVMLYEPLKNLVEGQTYRVFLNSQAGEFLDQLEEFAREMNSYIDEDAIINGLARVLRRSERIQSFAIYTVDDADQNLILKEGDDIRRPIGSLTPFPEPLIKTMLQRRGPVSRNQINIELRGGLSKGLRDTKIQLYKIINRLRASEVFPFIFGDHFFGFVSVGLEDPETDLTRNEEDMLTAISRQFAAALAHVKLAERARTRDRLVALGRLASGLAHEIRNPLATIKASIQYLEPTTEGSESAEFFSIINDDIDRLNRFVDRFLNYAKPAPSRTDIEKGTLLETLNKLIKGFKARTECAGIYFHLEIEEGSREIIVPVDAWNQLLTNLFDNAVKAMITGGEILITVRYLKESEMVEVAVEDSGPGIPEEERNLIYEPFFTKQEGGTGLGLAIVRQLVHRLDGDILCADSQLGGAGFFVRLRPLS
ncbi:hypothetical protein K8T06_10230 [bacterium]|nr:hypothetical protein [bacterium]